ncbi:RND family efflux transporter, MFP subunit [Mesonia phycicola]|uniref:RND family efflux transporter, MFP subunit n=2 Tax=Mesonia phycicola TaxID=579105 RepID=A0A1M6EQT2_9FLAO|nr:RND family efflux transporter, MFP subunit [Mesonia phycicola]
MVVSACGNKEEKSFEKALESNDLTKIRQKRTELVSQQENINSKIKELDTKISKLDTVKKIPLVTTIQAIEENFEHQLELQGNITTQQVLTIYPEYSGILTEVYVNEGDQVKKGQLLAKIDDGGLGSQLAKLKIQEELAKTTYERQKRLWDQNIGSEITFLQAESNYKAQQKAVSQLQQQIGKTQIRAPFTGTIDDVITEQGNVVSPGQSPLIRIVNLDNMYIETNVPERYIESVTKGKKTEVFIPVLNKTIETKIKQVANYVDPSNRTFKVEIDVPNKEKNIKPNLTAKVRINDYSSEKAILIPQSIISENANGEQYVYVVKNANDKNIGNANRTIIETGKIQGDVVEVTKGLQKDDLIINEGARSVKDGQSVEMISYEESK